MTPSVNRYRQFLHGILALLLFALAQSASAQWWRFGSDSGQPVFSDLLFNNVSALRVDRSLQFSPEDLDQHKIAVRGRAEVGQGKIGRVEASLDDGANWTAIPVGERGLFAFEFVPEIERAYRFKIRALSTTGQSSDEAEHAFEFKVVKEDNRALAKAAFQQLLERYMARDRSGFMGLVSREFLGNETALDSAISNDFRFFDSIRIEPTIQRMAASDNRWTIYFNFRRQVRSVRSGTMFKDQAMTSVTLIRDGDGYKLQELAAPLIFGVSDPSNVATYLTGESVGRNILTLDPKTGVVDDKQKLTTEGTTDGGDSGGHINIGKGTVELNMGQGYSLRTGSKVNGIQPDGDFAFGAYGPDGIFLGNEVEAAAVLGSFSLSQPRNIDPGNLSGMQFVPLQVGQVIGMKLDNGKYALVRLALQNGHVSRRFEYLLSDTPNFK
ncbi:hypothetical protein [Azonexus sp.]|uniref:hypothetical protein n=1 Tax=Azonexus sp. TaxID=1872668 RepID=UPI0035ADF973